MKIDYASLLFLKKEKNNRNNLYKFFGWLTICTAWDSPKISK